MHALPLLLLINLRRTQSSLKSTLMAQLLHWAITWNMVAQAVETLPATQEIWVQSLGWENPLEDGMAMHSSIIAWWATVHGITKSWTHCDSMDCSPPGSSVHGISKQEYWSGLPFLSPGALPDQRIEPRSPALQADSLPSEDIDRWVPWVPQTGHVAPYSILLLLCVTGKLWVQPKSYLGI